MKEFFKELVECRMQEMRHKYDMPDISFNHMCLTDFHNGKPSIYVGYEDGLGQVWDALLSKFEEYEFAERVFNMLGECFPNVPQYEL